MAVTHPKRHIPSHLAYNRQHATQQGSYTEVSAVSESGIIGRRPQMQENHRKQNYRARNICLGISRPRHRHTVTRRQFERSVVYADAEGGGISQPSMCIMQAEAQLSKLQPECGRTVSSTVA